MKAPTKTRKAALPPAGQGPTELTPSAGPVREVPYNDGPAKKGQKLTRRGSVSGTPGQAVSFANRWRENYNPFRGLTIRFAVGLLEEGQRGDYALLQWTYRKLERCYPTLSALISRCEAPLLNYKWDIKIRGELPDGYTQADAEKQQRTLRTAYEAIDNLKEAIRHLHMAEFREYSHIQKHRDSDGCVYHLECLDQWLICRDGIYGDWFWNPDSKFLVMPARVLGEENRIGGEVLPLEDFIIRTVPRPINEVAIITFVRWALVNKDWDAFIEIYGIPGGVVIMPQNVPPDKETEYQQAAKQVAEGGSGAMPAGSDYKPNDGPRGTDPFSPRIDQLDEDLVLAATGGKMGMLNAAAGLGGGNQGETHDDVFQEIAESRAAAISETFQAQFDAEVLEREHPGEPALVYFELAPKEDVDVDGLVKNVVSLASAGFKADVNWLSEQTGYTLSDAPEEKENIRVDDTLKGDKRADAEVDQTIQNRLRRVATAGTDEEFDKELAALEREFPRLGRALGS
jgi:phage gp29-like protein